MRCQCFGLFDVGGVIRTRRKRDGVLARISQHLEFVGDIAANGASVGLHGTEPQTQACKNPRVGVIHVLVFGAEAGFIEMEGIGILHQELARPHDAEARPDLVAELGLDLVEIDRQLLVAAQLVAGEVGNDFLVGRSVTVFRVLAVAKLQQLVAEFFPTSALIPKFTRLHRWHQQLDGTGAIHFLADDLLHFAQHAQPQRRPRVKPGTNLAQHAGAQHQPMTGQLGICGDFLDGGKMKTGETHWSDYRAWNRQIIPAATSAPTQTHTSDGSAAEQLYLALRLRSRLLASCRFFAVRGRWRRGIECGEILGRDLAIALDVLFFITGSACHCLVLTGLGIDRFGFNASRRRRRKPQATRVPGAGRRRLVGIVLDAVGVDPAIGTGSHCRRRKQRRASKNASCGK